jgi:Transposase DDE domain group 1
MSQDIPLLPVHPTGEQPPVEQDAEPAPATLDTWAGPVRVEWDPTAPLSALGQLPFFIEYLKVANLFDALLADCPLAYTSPNAPEKRDVLGTAMLSVLAGHKRYAHITALRNDGVLPELLGMNKIVSEDAVRRGFKAIGADEGREWLQRHLDYCTAPLLAEPWVLDGDTTVKPLYGHQEGALLGYNPRKPGRPSHVYHTYSMAVLRLVLDAEVAPGNEHASKYAAPGLWALLDRIPRDCWPVFLRGDTGFGTEPVMREAELRELPYLFRLRLTANVKKLIKKSFSKNDWADAGQGWHGREDVLRLEGWSRQRKVIILRRRLKGELAVAGRGDEGQLALGFVEIGPGADVYEYGVLVTSLAEEEILTLAQLYRDRGDSENPFDELENQWGWAGFTTRDLPRCQLMARFIALIYNWWNLFVRLAEPDKHLEAVTSRPLLLSAIAETTRHARQTTLRVSSSHAKAGWASKVLSSIARFLRELTHNAERLTAAQRWHRILSRAVRSWLGGRLLRAPPRLMAPA